MLVYRELKSFGAIPIAHHNLMPLLNHYKRPNDKIRDLVKKGYLIPLVKGKYVIHPEIAGGKPDRMLLANYLYGPSYVSLEYALSYYQAIPELVEEITSVTTRRRKTIENVIGRFSYIGIPLPYYSLGIKIESLGRDQNAIMATPEKALFDMVVCTRNLQLRSYRDAEKWLKDMRFDAYWLSQLDQNKMTSYLASAPKKESLKCLTKTITTYVA